MQKRARTTISLGLAAGLAAIVGACTAFSSESSETPDASAAGDAQGTDAPVSSSAPDTSTPDTGSSPEASAPDAAPRECAGGCPGGSFCEDGTCLPTLCTGDGGVVVVRPKRIVDQNGMLTTFPAGSSIRDAVVERGEGDDDATYVDAVIGRGNAAIKIESDFFALPTNRKIDAVNLRARSRRTTQAASAQIGLIYWFKASASIFGQSPKTNVGTGYDIVNFYLPVPPFSALGTEWTNTLVNDVQVGVEMIGAATNADDATVRLTQVWVEVCLKTL